MPRNRLVVALTILTLAIYAVLFLIYRDFIRENIVIPIASLAWIVTRMIRIIPQPVLLVGLVLMGVVISIMGLGEAWEASPRPARSISLPAAQSRYQFWLRRYYNLHRGTYFLDDMALELRRLLLDVLSSQEHKDTSEVADLIARGVLRVPPAVHDCIVNRRLGRPDNAPGRIKLFSKLQEDLRRRLASRGLPAGDEVDQHLEQIIAYLEDRLEGTQ